MQILLGLVDIHYTFTRKFVEYELTISVDKIQLLVYNDLCKINKFINCTDSFIGGFIMSGKTCFDCLFRGGSYVWDNDNYCNKLNTVVDDEQPACPNFVEDSEDCCYDCDGRKDTALGGFYCTVLNKKIKNPSHWRCPNFRY